MNIAAIVSAFRTHDQRDLADLEPDQSINHMHAVLLQAGAAIGCCGLVEPRATVPPRSNLLPLVHQRSSAEADDARIAAGAVERQLDRKKFFVLPPLCSDIPRPLSEILYKDAAGHVAFEGWRRYTASDRATPAHGREQLQGRAIPECHLNRALSRVRFSGAVTGTDRLGHEGTW